MIRTRLILLLGVTVLLPVLGGCPRTGTGSTVFLDARNDTQTATVHPGDRLIVLLRANASTGFSWQVGETDTAVLSNIQEAYVMDDATLTGSPGTSVFEFAVTATGTSPLTLNYVQAGAPTGTPPADTFSMTIYSQQ